MRLIKVIFICYDLPLNKQPHVWLWRKKDIARLPQSAIWIGRYYSYILYKTDWIKLTKEIGCGGV